LADTEGRSFVVHRLHGARILCWDSHVEMQNNQFTIDLAPGQGTLMSKVSGTKRMTEEGDDLIELATYGKTCASATDGFSADMPLDDQLAEPAPCV